MTTHLSPGRTHGVFSIILLLLFAFLAAGGAQTAGSAQTTLTLPDVVIEAGAYDPFLSPAAGRTEVSGDELRERGTTDVAQALEQVTGAWLQAAGASGGQKALSIRGSSTSQVLVLVDGVRVADPSFTVPDFSRLGISVDDIESITVIRGPASAQYGADAVGGVVLITTKRGADRTGLSVSAGNLSYLPHRPEALADGQNLAFRVRLPLGSGGLRVSARVEREAGAYPYLDASNARKFRENAALLGGSGSVAWEGTAGDGILSAGLDLTARDMGVPGDLIIGLTPNAHQRDAQGRATLRYATDYFISDSIAMKATGYVQHGIVEYKNPDSFEDDLHRGTQGGLDSAWSILFEGDSKATLGFSTRYERIDSTSVKISSGEAPERYSLGVFAEPILKLSRWSLSPALRFDWTSDYNAGFSGGLGIVYDISNELKTSFSMGTAYRAPTFNDLYWVFKGYPKLNPESAYSSDFSINYQIKENGRNIALNLAPYARYIKDLIIWSEVSPSVWKPSNIGGAFFPGVEVEASAEKDEWSVSGTYGFLYSYLLADSSGNYTIGNNIRVPLTPVHSGEGRISWRAKDGSFSGSLNASYKGSRYKNNANTIVLPAVFLLGASARLKFAKDWALSLQADNLLDTNYESVPGYPMPGFTLRTGLEFSH